MKGILISCCILFFSFHALYAQNFAAHDFASKTGMADSIFQLARKHLMHSRADSADYFLNMGISWAEKSGNPLSITKYYIEKSNVCFFRQALPEGMQWLRKINPLLPGLPYQLLEKYFFWHGLYFQAMSRTDSALYYFRKCQSLNEQNQPYRNWLVYNQLGILFMDAEAFSDSENYFNSAYEITKRAGRNADKLIVITQFADLYYRMGNAEKFALLMDEQQKYSRKERADDHVHGLIFIDWNKKPLDEKVAFMKQVNETLVRSGSRVNGALANNYIARFYEEENEPGKALDYIRQNQELFNKESDIKNLYLNTRIAYRLLKKARRFEEAVQEADQLLVLRDSIIQLSNRETLLDLEKKYQSERKERELVLLNAENDLNQVKLMRQRELSLMLMRESTLKDSAYRQQMEYNKVLGRANELKQKQLQNERELKASVDRENKLKTLQLTREKRIRLLLSSAALLLLASGITIFFFYRKQRAKNAIIRQQADDLEMLMKEIHHRVKNNLQVISSLLDLQSLTIRDGQASQAVREGRDRVYSMALIHQDLYRDQYASGIEINGYVRKLVESLIHSYNATGEGIKLDVKIDDIKLDLDQVVPIGLILNELVSNALKYAFRKQPNGALSILLETTDHGLFLKVKDNGPGFPQGMNIYQTKSFGFRLIRAFAQKLKAKLHAYNDDGACIELQMRKPKPV